jgi:hypothetical protein
MRILPIHKLPHRPMPRLMYLTLAKCPESTLAPGPVALIRHRHHRGGRRWRQGQIISREIWAPRAAPRPTLALISPIGDAQEPHAIVKIPLMNRDRRWHRGGRLCFVPYRCTYCVLHNTVDFSLCEPAGCDAARDVEEEGECTHGRTCGRV